MAFLLFLDLEALPSVVNSDSVLAVSQSARWDGTPVSALWLAGDYENPIVVDGTPAASIAILTGAGRSFATFADPNGSPIYIAADTPFASSFIRNVVNIGPTLSAIYLDNFDPFIVVGDIVAVITALGTGTYPTPAGATPLYRWAQGSGLGTFPAAQTYGWDVTPWTWTAAPPSLYSPPTLPGNQVIQGTGESTVPAVSVLWFPLTLIASPANFFAMAAQLSASVNAPGTNPIGIGLIFGSAAAELGVFVSHEMDGAGQPKIRSARWDGGTTIVTDSLNLVSVAAALQSRAILELEAGAQRNVGAAPYIWGTARDSVLVPTAASTPAAVFPSAAFPAAWNGVSMDSVGLIAYTTGGAAPGAGVAEAWDIGVWPRLEGGTVV